MKGNQGLDLLAAMSGDAAKADEGRPVAAAAPAAAPVAATASPAAGAMAAPAPPPAAQMAPSWPAPVAGPPGADALAAALAQQGGAGNLIQAAAGLICVSSSRHNSSSSPRSSSFSRPRPKPPRHRPRLRIPLPWLWHWRQLSSSNNKVRAPCLRGKTRDSKKGGAKRKKARYGKS